MAGWVRAAVVGVLEVVELSGLEHADFVKA